MPLARIRLALRLTQNYRRPPQLRRQHDLPHKEYFQNTSTYLAAETATPTPPTQEHPSSRSLLRSFLWAGLFSVLGFAYVEVSKTARWLDKSKRGPQREEAEMKEIRRKFTNDPLVKILEADPSWQSTQDAAQSGSPSLVQHADRFMATAMGGSQGIQMLCYVNPSKPMMCFIVYVGEGTEWGPRTAHAGGLACVFEDTLDWLGHRVVEVTQGRSGEISAILSHKSMQVDFLEDIPTGQLYAFWVVPAVLLGEDVADVLNVNELQGPKLTKDELRRTIVGLLERRDTLPYERGNSERYARARVTYDAAPKKPATRELNP